MNVTRRLEALRSLGATAAMPKDKTDPPRPIEDEEDETTTSKPDKEKKPMTEELDKAKAEGHDAGFKAANDRMNAVFASAHYEGRETQAKAMLAKSMSAEDIIDILAVTPKIEPSALVVEIDTEAVQRQAMVDAIAANKNSAIEAGGGDATKAEDAAPMIRAAAKVNEINGLK